MQEALAAAGLTDIPTDAVDCDIFIGERAWLGRGVGPQALRLLLKQLSAEDRFSMLGLCTSIENEVAVRAFEKAGFVRRKQYEDPTFGPCWVMVAKL
jgi:aminoglycoside 6'-N-acetyltransferase